MEEITLLAVADIHSPRFLSLYRSCLEGLDIEPDIVVFAGDIAEKNNVGAARLVFDITRRYVGDKPFIACYGNEEYRGFEDRYEKLYPDIIWLNDSYYIVVVKGRRIGFIGTRGALDKPTPWQQRNISGIEEYYRSLPDMIKELALEVRSRVDYLILVSHYSVTYRTLVGEPRRIWAYLGSKAMEGIIDKKLFDLVIHGHAHNSRVGYVEVNGVPVYNVSLPSRREVVVIRLGVVEKQRGLLEWLR